MLVGWDGWRGTRWCERTKRAGLGVGGAIGGASKARHGGEGAAASSGEAAMVDGHEAKAVERM